MYFDPKPKKSLADLFGRDEEVSHLIKVIKEKNPLIVISGLRRVGKTSLLGAVLNEKFEHIIWIDPRDFGSSTLSKKEILRLFQNSIDIFLKSQRSKAETIIGFLKHIRGFSFYGVSIQFNAESEIDLKELFAGLDRWATQNGTSVILAIDEAQDFAKSTEYALDVLLAGIYDKCSNNIIIILTGSEMGLLFNFLGDKDPTKPLYGRTREDIKLKPLTDKLSKQFLIEGFKQKGVDPRKDAATIAAVNSAVKKLDGIVGWLIKFAKKCLSNGKIDEEYILETQIEGSKQARQEFEKFSRLQVKEEAYFTIMKELLRLQTTSQIEFIEKFVENGSTKNEVQELLNEQFIVKIEEKYFIGDPLLQFSFEQEVNHADE